MRSRLIHSNCSRLSVVNMSKLRFIGSCLLNMGGLIDSGLYMRFSDCRLFPGTGPCSNSTRATVITDPPVTGIIYDDCFIHISIMNDSSVYVNNSSIIAEVTSSPSSTTESRSPISVSIIHTTIKSDMRTPISGVKTINS